MSSALEQSLDSIIGDNARTRGRETRGPNSRRDPRRRPRQPSRPQVCKWPLRQHNEGRVMKFKILIGVMNLDG